MPDTLELQRLFDHFVDEGRAAFSVGVLGAVAEFERSPDEPAQRLPAGIVTPRGGLALRPDAAARIVAYEACVGRGGPGWSHAIALCLPAAAAGAGSTPVLTELGPDHDALRPADRDAVLFDLGLGYHHLRACVRSADAGLVAAIRAHCGQPFASVAGRLAPQLVAASPHRVFVSKLARLEVYQPIPPHDGATPPGPHTHLLPKLMASGRAFSANLPIPPGWLPYQEIHPRAALHGADDGARRFDRDAFERFQPWLQRHGEPALQQWKQHVFAQVRNGDHAASHRHRGQPRLLNMTRRVALRQLVQLDGPSAVLDAWRREFD